MTNQSNTSRGPLTAFAKELIRASWEGCEGGDIIQEAALEHGLIKRVAFDPSIHEDPTGGDMDAGDPWFVFTAALQEQKK